MSQREASDPLSKVSTVIGIVAAISAVVSALLGPLGLGADLASLVAGFTCAVLASLWIGLTRAWRRPVKVLATIVFLGLATIWGFWVLPHLSQPKFDIAAMDTLEGDANTYEVTDFLIWNADAAATEFGLPITFTFEITPRYSGKQRYGSILAVISGEKGAQPLEKQLWKDFTSASDTFTLNLTLSELVKASGIGTNYDLPSGRFGSEGPLYGQAKLLIKIVDETDRTHPLDEQAITIRNGPWDFRSNLVSARERTSGGCVDQEPGWAW